MFVADCSTVSHGAPRLFDMAPKIVVGVPRLVVSTPMLDVSTCRIVISAARCSQLHHNISLVLQNIPKFLTITQIVLLYESAEIPVTQMASPNGLLESDTILTLMHLC